MPVTIFSDDFNDNSINTDKWDTLEYNTGDAVETNQRLEFHCPNSQDIAGLVTKSTYNFSNKEVKVLVHNTEISEVDLMISPSKTTNSNPYDLNEWYRIILYHHADYNRCYVQKKVSGSVTTLYYGSWISSEEVLKIRVEDNTVKFYEGDTQRASTSWELSSQNCYIYVYGRSGGTDYVGTDWADNFELIDISAEETPITAKALYNALSIEETPISAKALYNSLTYAETPITAKALYDGLIPRVEVVVTNESVTPTSAFEGDSVTYNAIVKDEYGNPLPEDFVVDLLLDSIVVVDNQQFVSAVYDGSTGELTLTFTVPETSPGSKTVKLKWEEQTI